MNLAIWANLFWKEWREHQWKLAALTAILFGTFFFIWAVDWQEGTLSAALIILFFYTPLASLFIGMGIAAGEQASGTISCLRRLPSNTRRAAIAKLTVGWLTVSVPGLALITFAEMTVLHGWEDPLSGTIFNLFGSGVWWFEIGSLFALASASLFVWATAIGVNHTSELRAGAIGLIVAVALWSIYAVAGMLSHPGWDPDDHKRQGQHATLLAMAAVPLPGGISVAGEILPKASLALPAVSWLLFSVAHAVLAAWFVSRFGCVVPAGKRTVATAARTGSASEWLRPPRRGRVEAILWKQFREAGPIIAGVVALAVGWTLFFLIDSQPHRLMHWIEVFTVATTMCGFLAALLVGLGSFQDDLHPGTSTFWRSRPIPPALFYWLKYAGGLAALATVFGSAFALSFQNETPEFHFESRYVIPGLIVFWLTYATAVTMAFLVRSVVYAGILTILPVGYGMAMAFSDEVPLPIAARVIVLILASVAITLLGWLSMRNDWSLSR